MIRRLIFWLFWREIRDFARWSMHSGRCTQSVSKKDLERFIENREKWIKIDSKAR